MTGRFYTFLGLAMKAGKIISGEETCERILKKGQVYLTIVANDASNNIKKKFYNLCSFRDVEYITCGEKSNLGTAIGKEQRAVLCVTDKGFSEKLLQRAKELSVILGVDLYGKN